MFSDIDLVVVGLWESLPLRTLERRLLERNIADPATIKVNTLIIMMAQGWTFLRGQLKGGGRSIDIDITRSYYKYWFWYPDKQQTNLYIGSLTIYRHLCGHKMWNKMDLFALFTNCWEHWQESSSPWWSWSSQISEMNGKRDKLWLCFAVREDSGCTMEQTSHRCPSPPRWPPIQVF